MTTDRAPCLWPLPQVLQRTEAPAPASRAIAACGSGYRYVGYWMGRIIEPGIADSNLKCTNQLVFRAIIEQNGRWRIDDFSSTTHHRQHIEPAPNLRASIAKDPEHTIKISKIGYTLMLALNATLFCLLPQLSSAHASHRRLQTDTLRPLG
jgi:hypothetical protein